MRKNWIGSWWKRRYRHCWGNSLIVPYCPGQVLMETGGISGCSQGLRHHWLLLGAGDITRHSRVQGSLLDACGDQEHCHILTWVGTLPDVCKDQGHCQVLAGPGSLTRCSTSSISRCDAHGDWGHPLGAHGV